MPTYPDDVTLVRIRHTPVTTGGRILAGNLVSAVVSERVWGEEGSILPAEHSTTIQADGSWEIELPAVDSPGMRPQGAAYRITEHVPGGRALWAAPLVHHAPGPVDLADVLTPAPSPGGGITIQTGPATDASMAEIADNPDSAFRAALDGAVTPTATAAGAQAAIDTLADQPAVTDAAATRAVTVAADPAVAGAVADVLSQTRAAMDVVYGAPIWSSAYGAVGDGVADDTAALQAALSDAAARSGTLHLKRGRYKIGEAGLAATNVDGGAVQIIGEPGTVLDMTGVTETNGLHISGRLDPARFLASDAIKGATTIHVDLPTPPQPGDVLRIVSTDVWVASEGTPKGEMVEVAAVNGSTIDLVSPLYDSYAAATSSARRVAMPQVTLRDLTVVRDSNQCGVLVENARDVLLSGLHVEGAREALIRLSYAYGGVVENCAGTDFFYAGTSTSYGLSVASSQHITEIANRFRGGRHAVMHGGWLPCRDITIIGGTYDSHHGVEGRWSVDFHANCENVRVIGVTALNGLGAFCSNISIESSDIRNFREQGIEASLSRDSDYFRVINCDVVGEVNGIYFTRRPGSAPHTLGVFEVSGGSVRGGHGVRVDVHDDTTPDAGHKIQKILIDSDVTGSAGNAVSVLANSTGSAPKIDVLDLRGDFRGSSHGAFCNTGDVSIGEVVVHDARVSAGGTSRAPLNMADGVTDLTVRATRLTGPDESEGHRESILTGVTGLLALESVTIVGAVIRGGINAPNAREALVTKLRLDNTGGSPVLPPRTYYERGGSGDVLTDGTAPPTTGAWARGDRIFHSSPAVGQPQGWVCTEAGTPGTWVPMPNL